MEKSKLNEKNLAELRDMAKILGVKSISKFKKAELIDQILFQIKKNQNEKENQEEKKETNIEVSKEENDDSGKSDCEGILDVFQEGYGFLRSDKYDSGEDDVYVPPTQVNRFHLKTGDYIEGIAGSKREKDKFAPLIYVKTINGANPENMYKRPNFEDLIPIYPTERLVLETDKDEISTRIIDLISPVGKGQRGLIVSPPKAGKTTLLRNIATAIEKKHPEVKIFILLIDERPEEVTEMIRSVNKNNPPEKRRVDYTEVVASTFDMPASNHERLSEIVLERAKRFVENGKDVVILLDSITRLSRAYNITTPPSGRTLSGGLDPVSLYKPKRFFGAARNIEGGGSLTILGTCLIDTGSRMDDMIYEEFKGTGNMEIILNRELAELRLYPAIDIYKSGTRREELLLTEKELEVAYKIRKLGKDENSYDVITQLSKMLKNTKNNEEFCESILNSVNKKL